MKQARRGFAKLEICDPVEQAKANELTLEKLEAATPAAMRAGLERMHGSTPREEAEAFYVTAKRQAEGLCEACGQPAMRVWLPNADSFAAELHILQVQQVPYPGLEPRLRPIAKFFQHLCRKAS